MLFNARFFVHFALFLVFLYATFSGLSIVKVRCYESPFGAGRRVEGTPAVLAGAGLVAVGLAALVGIIALVVW